MIGSSPTVATTMETEDSQRGGKQVEVKKEEAKEYLKSLISYDLPERSAYEKLGIQFVDEWVKPYLKDERDVVFVHWMFGLSCLMFGLASYVVYSSLKNSFSWIAGILYVFFYFRYLGTFILMLHCTSHDPPFKQPFKFMNHYLSFVLGPFFGESPETYYVHHIKMHHVEGNGPKDLSCTWNYQRDNPLHFMHYYLRFYLFTIIELPIYFLKKKQYSYAARMILGESIYHLAYLFLWFYVTQDWRVALFLYIIPCNITRLGMMSGNWVQHAFIDSSQPMSDYKSSITCINSDYNRWCFNDGYHTSHHLHPTRHWTEHPQKFLDKCENYFKNGTIIFKGLDYHMIFALLMIKRYDVLANRIVLLDGDINKPKEDIIQALKERVKPVPLEKALS